MSATELTPDEVMIVAAERELTDSSPDELRVLRELREAQGAPA